MTRSRQKSESGRRHSGRPHLLGNDSAASSYAEQLAELDEENEDTHDEYAVMDRAGRIQIPANFLEALGMQNSNKVKVQLENNRIVLRPPDVSVDTQK